MHFGKDGKTHTLFKSFAASARTRTWPGARAVLLTPFILLLAVSAGRPVSAAGSLQVLRVSCEYNEPQLRYSCSYPRVSGIQDAGRQQRINVILREKAETSVEEARYVSKGLDGSGTLPSGVTGKFEYEVRRNDNGILSLTLRGVLRAGGGRETVTQSGETVGTVTGKSYRLHDLFVAHADYAGVIGGEVKRQLAQKGLLKKLSAPLRAIGGDEGYYLTDDALVVFFAQNEILPAEYGIQEFPIPLKSLDGILKPEFRL